MTKKSCPLGEDCDLTIAWMKGAEDARDKAKARTDDLKREIQELKNQAQFWQERAEYWRDLWSKAANRLLQVDPELSGPMTTKAEEIHRIAQALKNPPQAEPPPANPWKDV